ncbi:hypothetical protein Scep_016109 [Stephania cephalantha]|uniref:Cyclic nucleotide-binding domain-containing protein n=1 Tax=Stephania cephalantha TaxID=152367 RepID=A0AAP0NVH0_9MAGN
MTASEKEDLPMLSGMSSYSPDEHIDIAELQRFTVRNRSASMSTTPRSLDYDGENFLVSHTGPLRSERRTPLIQMSGPLLTSKKPDKLVWPILDTKGRLQQVDSDEYPSSNQVDQKDSKDNLVGKNEHLLRSGPLGMCNDPYCTTCPTLDSSRARQQKNYRAKQRLESKFHHLFAGDAKDWMKKSSSILSSCWPGVMNPHAKVVQQWNKFFVISCLVSIFIDPLFFFLLTALEKYKCIVLHWSLATAIASVRSITDFIYFMHMLLQFRLAYIAPETRVVGAGELVDQPKKIALHYLRTYFFIDVFVVLPLPQIMILLVLPKYVGSSSANYAKNLLRATVLLQYVPKFYRFLPLLAGRSASGFIFETAWANFVINLLIYVLAGHVVGSGWYLFGLQRVNQCLRKACTKSKINYCKDFIDCGTDDDDMKKKFGINQFWNQWTNNTMATDCFKKDGDFKYGIYGEAVELTTISSVITRYIYSLFWGFQQLSTLAGNLVPSKFEWEVLFTMGIVGLGLFLFALLIGNMQNFLQSLGKRRLEMQLRRQDVEQWMNHRRLPEEIRRQVRESERFNWAATRGVNEEWMLENLPDDLQREIRRHLFKFVEKVRIFTIMEDPILDAIRERLRQRLYIKGSKILYNGGTVDKMTFIVRGKMESVDANGNVAILSEGDTCGEELLTWYLDQSSVPKEGRKNIRIPGRVLSNRTVTCIHNVEVFTLRDSDLEEVTSLFSRFLRSPRFQGSLRYVSPYWRALAVSRIQVAWRYRKKRLSRLDTASNGSAPAQR